MSSTFVNLGDAVREDGGVLQTGPFGSQLKQAEYSDDGVPVIMPKDIRNGEIVTETVARVPEATADRLARHRIAANGVVLPRRGEVTKRAFIAEAQEGWLCGTGCLKVETTGKRIWPKYLYYYMGTPSSIEWLERNAVGSTMLNLSSEIVSRFPIRLPLLEEQKRIASILSAYDDLIENNRRRIALLEEAARLLYREWFVHFRFPGHEHVPIIDGLPEGWERVCLSDKFETTSGGTPSRQRPEFFEGDINWVKTQELDEKPIFSTAEKITEEAVRRSSAKLLPAHTLLVSIYGNTNIGRTGILAVPGTTNQACVALFPKRKPQDWIYAQLWLQSIRDYVVGLAQGAAQTNISQQTLRGLRLVWPKEFLLDAFIDVTRDQYQQIECLCQQNQKLAQARDLLLPRLMNGEIAV